MTRALGRRKVLKAALAAGCAPALLQTSRAHAREPGAGALLPDPARLLDLPSGFAYRVIGRAGERMSDGYRVPARPDAMGCFAGPDGTIILMRNHEMLRGDHARGPYFPGQAPPAEAYDPEGTGGVTRIVLDAETLAVRSTNLVLAGTFWNCAGGHSPWGWLSCEETADPGHGYVFLCPVDAERVQPAQRLSAYGRMRHEAAVVDPRTSIAYLTEDEIDACLYRFVPHDPAEPFAGKLQALRVRDQPGLDTGTLPPGKRAAVEWVDVGEPEPANESLRSIAQARGAARFRRTEGVWLAGDQLFFTATVGGAIGRGQILRLTLGEPNELDVIAESTDPEVLDMPDNLCVSPDGLLYVAEDGLGGNFLLRVGLDGTVTPFARNAASTGEFAGPCFSPDGQTLFVNLQLEGLTLAIRGPFEREAQRASAETAAGAETRADLPWGRAGRGIGTGLAVVALAMWARARRGREREGA
jgi:uncharacterized protein